MQLENEANQLLQREIQKAFLSHLSINTLQSTVEIFEALSGGLSEGKAMAGPVKIEILETTCGTNKCVRQSPPDRTVRKRLSRRMGSELHLQINTANTR